MSDVPYGVVMRLFDAETKVVQLVMRLNDLRPEDAGFRSVEKALVEARARRTAILEKHKEQLVAAVKAHGEWQGARRWRLNTFHGVFTLDLGRKRDDAAPILHYSAQFSSEDAAR